MRGRLTYYGALAGLAIGLAGLVTGAATWDWGYGAGMVGLALSVVLFVPEWARLRRPDIALVYAPPLELGPDLAPGGEVVRLPEQRTEVGVAWCEVDRLLPVSLAVCEFSRLRRRLPRRIGRFTYAVLVARSRSQRIYNGRLVRQDDDLRPDVLASGGPVSFSRTDYFSMVCSNYLTGWRIIDRRTGTVEVEGADLFLSDGRLLPLVTNHQANGIGVSTLAFTTDGRLVLALQDPRSASSAGLVAPSGSGSVDLRDVRRLRSGDRSVVRFVACAMQRELVEESNLRYRDIEWTEVLGYFRWLTAGGKPEYVGVTKLRLHSDDLAGRDVRIVEAPFVQRLAFDCTLDLSALRAEPENLRALDKRFHGVVSMPLFMCLRALGRALARDDQLAARLATLQIPDPRL